MRQSASLWIERLARLGYAAKGIVYGIVGVLALQVALGIGGRTTDTQGALTTIVRQPFGKFLLSLVAIGLLSYALWRFVEALKDPENKGTDAKGLASRAGSGVSGLIYGGLAFSALKIVLGSSGAGGGNSTADSTARLMAQPFGQWLVGTVGAFILGLGIYHFYRAYSAKFRKNLKLTEMTNTQETWAIRLGRFGLAARGVVLSITGIFLIQAARQSDPQEARGLSGALDALAQQPYGPLLLGIVALGLMAYGTYMVVEARFRRIVAV